MVEKANWELYYLLESKVGIANDAEMKGMLEQFNMYDFLSIPIVFDLVECRSIRLLRLLYKKGVPLTYESDDGSNALHVACGAGGSLECAKFFIENNILTDINKVSSKHCDTPLTLAISYNHTDILDYFKTKFAVNSVSLSELDVILGRVKSNCRKRCSRLNWMKEKQ